MTDADIVDRLIAEGSDLSLEAAEKIEALRKRGKFWERETIKASRSAFNQTIARAMAESARRLNIAVTEWDKEGRR